MTLSMLRLAVIALTLLVAGAAYSTQPSPTPPKASHQPETTPKQPEQRATTDQRGTENSPVFITVIPPVSVESQAAKEAEKYRDYMSAEWWLIYITGFLVAATIGLMIYTARLWRATNTLAIDAKKTAERQAREMQASLRIAQESADAAKKTAQHMEIADRAYMKISHVPPGLVPVTPLADYLDNQSRTYEIVMDVRNIGKTPAELTRLSFNHIILLSGECLPDVPPYNADIEEGAIKTIMHGTDAIFPSPSFVMSGVDKDAIGAGTKTLYVLGYADYIDHFGTHHRAGYARRYNPRDRENNLFIVTQPGYNYDERT